MSHIPKRNNLFVLVLLISISLIMLCLAPTNSWSTSSEVRLSKGQTVYVSAYSNVFTGPRKLPFQLATTLSIRSTDLSTSFQITSIDYYGIDGKLIRHYLGKPLVLGPLTSTYVHIEEKDISGGFGANFIVRWKADRVINTPIIECVMIGATSGQGISFVSPGQEIKE